MTPDAYLATRPRWLDEAACRHYGPDWDLLDPASQLDTCARCPVRDACLAHAITTRAVGVTQAGYIIDGRPLREARAWKDPTE